LKNRELKRKDIYIFDTKAKKYNGIEVATLINKKYN